MALELFGLDADEAVELLGSVNEANHERRRRRPVGRYRSRPSPPCTPPTAPEMPTSDPGRGALARSRWPDVLRTTVETDPTGRSWSRCSARIRITAFGRAGHAPACEPGRRPCSPGACCAPKAPPSTRSSTPCGPTPRPTGCSSSSGTPSATCAPTSAAPTTRPSKSWRRSASTTGPSPAEITCDLWDFQAALGDAARAGDDRAGPRRAAPGRRRLPGRPAGRRAATPWVEPVRQDLHRRAVDAHLRLAELEDHAGHPDAAVAVLERVIDLDRYAEEPYRRLMALHAAHGRHDAVTATWQLLQRRLADLDVDVDEATARLYRTLTAPDPDAPTSTRPIRLSS